MKQSILILGEGMLGDAVAKILPKADICPYRYPSQAFKDCVRKYEYVINAAGRVPQTGRTDFSINTQLPVFLEKYTEARIIHPSSDCEDDETEYGLSKKIATDWILGFAQQTKIIKCSIIGIDKNNQSFLSWVLSQKEQIPGYTSAIWSGITSIHWAKIAKDIIENWGKYNIIQRYHTTPTSKYDLIQTICEVFNKDNIVIPVDKGEDRTMLGTYVGEIEEQLVELKKIYGI